MATTVYNNISILKPFANWDTLIDAEVSGGILTIHPGGSARCVITDELGIGLTASEYLRLVLSGTANIVDEYDYTNWLGAVLEGTTTPDKAGETQYYRREVFVTKLRSSINGSNFSLSADVSSMLRDFQSLSFTLYNRDSTDAAFSVAQLFRSVDMTVTEDGELFVNGLIFTPVAPEPPEPTEPKPYDPGQQIFLQGASNPFEDGFMVRSMCYSSDGRIFVYWSAESPTTRLRLGVIDGGVYYDIPIGTGDLIDSGWWTYVCPVVIDGNVYLALVAGGMFKLYNLDASIIYTESIFPPAGTKFDVAFDNLLLRGAGGDDFGNTPVIYATHTNRATFKGSNANNLHGIVLGFDSLVTGYTANAAVKMFDRSANPQESQIVCDLSDVFFYTSAPYTAKWATADGWIKAQGAGSPFLLNVLTGQVDTYVEQVGAIFLHGLYVKRGGIWYFKYAYGDEIPTGALPEAENHQQAHRLVRDVNNNMFLL